MGFGDKFLFELDRIWRLFAKFDCGNIKDANEVIFVTFFMFGGIVGFGPRCLGPGKSKPFGFKNNSQVPEKLDFLVWGHLGTNPKLLELLEGPASYLCLGIHIQGVKFLTYSLHLRIIKSFDFFIIPAGIFLASVRTAHSLTNI